MKTNTRKQVKLETECTNGLGELYFCAMYHVASYWEPGIVGRKTANKIRAVLGVDLAGYRIRLYTNDLKHLLNRHYSETERDLVPVRMRDIENLESIVNDCHGVEKGRSPGQRVHFVKEIPAGTAHFVAEIRPREKVLAGITLWIRRR